MNIPMSFESNQTLEYVWVVVKHHNYWFKITSKIDFVPCITFHLLIFYYLGSVTFIFLIPSSLIILDVQMLKGDEKKMSCKLQNEVQRSKVESRYNKPKKAHTIEISKLGNYLC
jgi:hypothetical protein